MRKLLLQDKASPKARKRQEITACHLCTSIAQPTPENDTPMTISFLDSGPRVTSAQPIDTFDRIREPDRTGTGPRFGQVMAEAQQQQADRAPSHDNSDQRSTPSEDRQGRQEVADSRARASTEDRNHQDAREAADRQEARDQKRVRDDQDRNEQRASATSQRVRTSAPARPDQQPAGDRTSDANGTETSSTNTLSRDGSSSVPLSNMTDPSRTAPDGQHPAAPVVSMVSDLSAAANPPLKAVILGPNLNAITPQTAAPNEQSLEAFARSQGLDERAVQWLMGGETPSPTKTLGLIHAQTTDSTGINSETATISPSSDQDASISDSLKAGLYGSLFMAPAAPPVNAEIGAMPGLPLAAPVSPTSLPGSVEVTTQATLATPAAGPLVMGTPASAGGQANVLVSAFAALMQGKPDDSLTPKAPASAGTESEAQVDLQNSSLRLPPPAPMWMQQIKAATATWVAPPTRNQVASISVSDLDLSADISQEVIDQLTPGASPPVPGMSATSHPVPGTAVSPNLQGGRSEAPAPGTTTPPAQTDSAQRSENIQNLATKMGQAVGERILSEIEKGQWHLKLQLRPATLGHIEVEMRMRSGEMDATFTAPQALTRELLQEGMSRLKDTMAQMGMNVANLNVGDGQTQERGGESTHRSSASAGSPNAPAPGQTETVTASAPRAKISADGLDVLV